MDLTGKHYTWFQNRDCEYFPCHKDVKEEEFNCLFCYCPLSAGASYFCGRGFFLILNVSLFHCSTSWGYPI